MIVYDISTYDVQEEPTPLFDGKYPLGSFDWIPFATAHSPRECVEMIRGLESKGYDRDCSIFVERREVTSAKGPERSSIP